MHTSLNSFPVGTHSSRYTKIQAKTQTVPSSTISFSIIAPTATSTPHVAAAAFYHCLGVWFYSPPGNINLTRLASSRYGRFNSLGTTYRIWRNVCHCLVTFSLCVCFLLLYVVTCSLSCFDADIRFTCVSHHSLTIRVTLISTYLIMVCRCKRTGSRPFWGSDWGPYRKYNCDAGNWRLEWLRVDPVVESGLAFAVTDQYEISGRIYVYLLFNTIHMPQRSLYQGLQKNARLYRYGFPNQRTFHQYTSLTGLYAI